MLADAVYGGGEEPLFRGQHLGGGVAPLPVFAGCRAAVGATDDGVHRPPKASRDVRLQGDEGVIFACDEVGECVDGVCVDAAAEVFGEGLDDVSAGERGLMFRQSVAVGELIDQPGNIIGGDLS